MERSRTNHERLWAAIDAIATRYGLSPSGLARRAGLDATAFNKSKRFTADGRPRWPSTESIAKILGATGCDLVDFVDLIGAGLLRTPTAPFTARTVRPAFDGFHDDGGEIVRSGEPMSVQVHDHGMLPLYRKGDVLIVSATEAIRPGDRVVLRVDDGSLEAWVFLGRDPDGYALEAIGGGARQTIAAARVSCLARILWASQ